MVGKNQIKLIKNLHQKKYRSLHGIFVAEGVKLVSELLASDFSLHWLYTTDLEIFGCHVQRSEKISDKDLKRISGLHTPNKVLAIFDIPDPIPLDFGDWVVALDDVRDPGNLGTIIRLCDWFGIKHLLCSKETVDCYNPKVLQATMGSIARVNVVYDDLGHVFETCGVPVFGTFMDGESVYVRQLPQKGILVMGNEARGISKELEAFLESRLGIPQFGGETTESLNVAMATSVLLSEIRRQ